MEIPPRPDLPGARRAQRLAAQTPVHTNPRAARRRGWIWAVAIVYLVILVYIVFWPEPSDFGISPWLRRIREIVPALTATRVEFVANVLLFVPLGAGLAMMLHRHRYLVVPLGFLATLTIEGIQALLLVGRSPTVIDLIANFAGACVGLVAVAAFEGLLRHRAPDYSGAAQTR
ncbi:VanZ family protein [Microbacterium sp. LWH12-1.2]|uniref:VanZ family protein n=1 Tax=Microbacterium sp. LWH12-1.2 TaxID=3135259 RepID=UPI003414170E